MIFDHTCTASCTVTQAVRRVLQRRALHDDNCRRCTRQAEGTDKTDETGDQNRSTNHSQDVRPASALLALRVPAATLRVAGSARGVQRVRAVGGGRALMMIGAATLACAVLGGSTTAAGATTVDAGQAAQAHAAANGLLAPAVATAAAGVGSHHAAEVAARQGHVARAKGACVCVVGAATAQAVERVRVVGIGAGTVEATALGVLCATTAATAAVTGSQAAAVVLAGCGAGCRRPPGDQTG